MYKVKYGWLLSLCLLVWLGVSCTEQLDGMGQEGNAGTQVKASISDFKVNGTASPVDGENRVDEMQACLFEDGKLTEVYSDLQETDGSYALKVERMSGTLYLLANAARWVDVKQLQIGGTTEEEWLATTVEAQDKWERFFFSGSLDLGQQTAGQATLPISLKRGVARFDVIIKSEGIAIDKVTLKNVMQEGYLLEQSAVVSPKGAQRKDEVFSFENPLTEDLQGMAYVCEQANPDLSVVVEASVGGKKVSLKKDLPDRLKRNAVYTLTVREDQVPHALTLEVAAWEDGGESALRPDLDSHLIIDKEASKLPAGAEVNTSGDVLTLTSAAADFILAVTCDMELKLEYVPTPESLVTLEPITGADGVEGKNLFRVHKRLLPPNYPSETIDLQFRRKGLDGIYEEDRLRVVVQANPIVVSGELEFDKVNYTCDFGRYVENELGRFSLPEGYGLRASFDAGEDSWIAVKAVSGESSEFRVLGGWKPNDPKADGQEQAARLVVYRLSDDQETEAYTVKRLNYGLPVTYMNGLWWCKYNARGNAKDFKDQILVPDDPAVNANKPLLYYLADCSDQDYLYLWGWSYLGDTGIGLQAVEDNGKVVFKGYAEPAADFNKVDPKSLAPTGYEVPTLADYNRLFMYNLNVNAEGSRTYDATDPNYKNLTLTVKKRPKLTVGGVVLSDLLNFGVSNSKGEYVVFYGPGAQWNGNGINHNKVIFGCYSTNGQNYFNHIDGGNLLLWNITKGNTRVVRFIKSPVEYTYN